MKLPNDIGAIFKRTTTKEGTITGFRDIQINLFREGYTPTHRPKGYVFLALLAIVTIVGLYFVSDMTVDASNKASSLQNQLDEINQQIEALQAPSPLQPQIDEINAQAKALEQARQTLLSESGKVIPTIEAITEAVPNAPRFSSINLGSSQITLEGYAKTPSNIFNYATALKEEPEFSETNVTSIGETTEAASVEETSELGSTAIEITEIRQSKPNEGTETSGSTQTGTGFLTDISSGAPVNSGTGPDTAGDSVTFSFGVDPVAKIGMEVMTPTDQEPVIVKFTDESIPGNYPIVSWLWDFGDGTTSTAQNIFHTYKVKGSYTITLSITDSRGLTFMTHTGGNAFDRPTANFTAAPASCEDPLTVKFTDLSTSPGSLTSWKWDFDNDGNTDSTDRNPTHTFPSIAAYTISLTIEGSLHQPATVTKMLTLSEPPTADFSVIPVSGENTMNLKFTDQSVANGKITGWLWTFGDGTTSIDQNPTHSYTGEGPYTVSLKAFGDNGSCNIMTKTIKLSSGFSPDFTVAPASTGNPLDVQFTDNSHLGNTPATWLWDFGDGKIGTGQNPVHSYASEGTYTVSMSITRDMSDPNKPEIVLNTTGGATAQIEVKGSTATPFTMVVKRASQ